MALHNAIASKPAAQLAEHSVPLKMPGQIELPGITRRIQRAQLSAQFHPVSIPRGGAAPAYGDLHAGPWRGLVFQLELIRPHLEVDHRSAGAGIDRFRANHPAQACRPWSITELAHQCASRRPLMTQPVEECEREQDRGETRTGPAPQQGGGQRHGPHSEENRKGHADAFGDTDAGDRRERHTDKRLPRL